MAKRTAADRDGAAGRRGKRDKEMRSERPAAGPFGRIDERALTGLAERLRAIDYEEGAASRRLGAGHVAALSRERVPLYRARLAAGEPLDVAIAFLLLGEELPAAALAPLLGEDGSDLLEQLVACGMVSALGRGRSARLRSTTSIFPCAGALIATDPRFPRGGDAPGSAEREGRPARDAVMYLGGDSYSLAYLAPRRAMGSALDLCTGSGVHAILAARHVERVTAVDISPRALAFGRLNAAMNGLSGRIDWRRGDLFAPLAAEDRFDLVLANPPFVPSPYEGRARLLYRDGGRDGAEIVERLLRGLPARLEREGLAAVVSVFAEKQGETLRGWVERRLPRGAELSGIFVRLGDDAPLEYAFSQTRRPYGDSPELHTRRFGRWVESLERAHVRRLAGGVLTLKPHLLASAPWWRTIDAPPPLSPDPQGLERMLKACDAALGAVFAEELLDRRAAAAPDIVFVDEMRRPTQEELRRIAGEEDDPAAGTGPGSGGEAGTDAPGAGEAGAQGPGGGRGEAGPAGRAGRAGPGGRGAGGGAGGAGGGSEDEAAPGKGKDAADPGADPDDAGAKDAPPGADDADRARRRARADDEPRADEDEGGSSEEAPSLVPQRHRVRAVSALGAEVGLSGELRALLERADGTRTLRAVIAGMAGEVEADPRELEERMLADALELAARGFLVLDKA